MSLPTLDFEGRVYADPELRYTPQGKAVVEVTIACNSRRFNRQTDEWENGDTYWINRATAWEEKAEAIAETIRRGDIVCGTCQLRTRSYEDRDGNKRTATDHRILTIGIVPRIDRPTSQTTTSTQPQQPQQQTLTQDEEPPF